MLSAMLLPGRLASATSSVAKPSPSAELGSIDLHIATTVVAVIITVLIPRNYMAVTLLITVL